MTQPARPTHWWHAVDRRTFSKGAVAFTALLSMSGCKSEKEQAADSLKLQQEQGWNVGAKESRLFFTSTTEQDASGSTEWRGGVGAKPPLFVLRAGAPAGAESF